MNFLKRGNFIRIYSLFIVLVIIIYTSLVDLQKIYDAYTHMFLASHYMIYWGEIFDPRWYLGFNISTYLPFFHESLALTSLFIGLENSFRVALFIATFLLIDSLYKYYQLFFKTSISSYSLIFLMSIPSLYIFLFLFGQIPQLLSISFSLTSIYYLDKYFENKIKTALVKEITFLSIALIVHTLTIIVYLSFLLCYLISHNKGVRSILKNLDYLLAWVIPAIIALPIIYLHAISIIPQNPIPHGSRYPFSNIDNFLFFFLNIYGLQVLLYPLSLIGLILRKELSKKEICYVLFTLFFLILGLGYTTPLPNLLFSSWSAWLTYDRFSLIASLLMPPIIVKFLDRNRVAVLKVLLILMLVLSLISVEYSRSQIFPSEDIDVEVLANFIKNYSGEGYTHLTLGFGVPALAKLSIYSNLYTIDGTYPTARGHIRILSRSGIETIDSAKLYPNGLSILNYILSHKKEYGIRLIFTADDFYDSLLYRYGYKPIGIVKSGRKVIIWESETEVEKININPLTKVYPLLAYYWFITPILLLFITLAFVLKEGLTLYIPKS